MDEFDDMFWGNGDTTLLEKDIQVFERAFELLCKSEPDSIDYAMYSAACIKEFDIILGQSRHVLKFALRPYCTEKEKNGITIYDVFPMAFRKKIISLKDSKRWIKYEECREDLEYEDDCNFAHENLKVFPEFINDAKLLLKAIKDQNDPATVI